MNKENLKVVAIKRNADVTSLLKLAIENIEADEEQPVGAIILLAYKDSGMDGLEIYSSNLGFHQQIGVLETAKMELFSES
jgi:hypothetical protein